MLEIDFTVLNALPNERARDAFSPRMDYGVPSVVDTAPVVAKEANWIRDGNTHILQNAFEPHSFTHGDCCAPIFGLCVRQCDSQLLLVALGDRSATEAETNPEVDLLSAL